MDSGSLLKAVMGTVRFECHLVDGFLMDNHATSPIVISEQSELFMVEMW